MPLTCDMPTCTTLALMLGEGRVEFRREREDSIQIEVVWRRNDGTRFFGYGDNVRDAIADCVEARLGE